MATLLMLAGSGLAATGAAVATASAAHAADTCVGVRFRFTAVRGSGEQDSTGGTAGNTAEALYNDIKGHAPAGVTTALTGIDCAAVGLPNWWDKINLARYESSKSSGVRNLRTYLTDQESCLASGEKWVFIGFSQGAHVIGDSLSSANGLLDSGELADTAAVVLIADPRFNSREGFDAGSFQDGRNGLLGARSPGDLDAVSGKVRSWCDAHDPVCQSVKGQQSGVHDGTRYESAYKDAMVSFLRSGLGWLPSGSGIAYTGPLDVALAIDTTGSMGSSIDSVKASSIALFDELTALDPNARLGLVDYVALTWGWGEHQLWKSLRLPSSVSSRPALNGIIIPMLE